MEDLLAQEDPYDQVFALDVMRVAELLEMLRHLLVVVLLELPLLQVALLQHLLLHPHHRRHTIVPQPGGVPRGGAELFKVSGGTVRVPLVAAPPS
eukprot:5518829-Pyramimonas_sp.AAC.2